MYLTYRKQNEFRRASYIEIYWGKQSKLGVQTIKEKLDIEKKKFIHSKWVKMVKQWCNYAKIVISFKNKCYT